MNERTRHKLTLDYIVDDVATEGLADLASDYIGDYASHMAARTIAERILCLHAACLDALLEENEIADGAKPNSYRRNRLGYRFYTIRWSEDNRCSFFLKERGKKKEKELAAFRIESYTPRRVE